MVVDVDTVGRSSPGELLRRRILTLVLVATIVAVLAFGIPLALAAQRLIANDERSELEAIALRAAAAVSAAGLSGQDPIELTNPGGEIDVAIYSKAGGRVTGTGPVQSDAVTQAALGGDITFGQDDGELIAAVPVVVGEVTAAAARASSPSADVRTRVIYAWLLMAGVALAAVGLARVLSLRQTTRLSRAVDGLTVRARALGSGDFRQSSQVSGISEIDQAAAALDHTASRLQTMIERERTIGTRTSHQLRTPLTAMRLRVEAALADSGADVDVDTLLRDILRLSASLMLTIDDLVALARGPRGETKTINVADLLGQAREAWHGHLAAQGRPLRLTDETNGMIEGDEAAVRQVLFTLLDNATRHGQGTVRVDVRSKGRASAIVVTDDGSWTDPAEWGTGLTLADELARALGGRFVMTQDHPTRFTLYLPPGP